MYFLQCNKYMVKYPNLVSVFLLHVNYVLFNDNNLGSEDPKRMKFSQKFEFCCSRPEEIFRNDFFLSKQWKSMVTKTV